MAATNSMGLEQDLVCSVGLPVLSYCQCRVYQVVEEENESLLCMSSQFLKRSPDFFCFEDVIECSCSLGVRVSGSCLCSVVKMFGTEFR